MPDHGTVTVIRTGEHDCILPPIAGATGIGVGAVVQCDACAQYWSSGGMLWHRITRVEGWWARMRSGRQQDAKAVPDA